MYHVTFRRIVAVERTVVVASDDELRQILRSPLQPSLDDPVIFDQTRALRVEQFASHVSHI
jgi:hypothetical protein